VILRWRYLIATYPAVEGCS